MKHIYILTTILFFSIYNLNAQQVESLNFDGIDDYIDLSSGITSSLNSQNSFTVEAIVYNTSITGTAMIVGNHATGTSTQFALRRVDDEYQLMLGFGVHAITTTISAAELNTWQHISAVKDNNDLKLYINGALVASSTIPSYALPSSTSKVYIGTNSFNELFTGSIDEVRIWENARSASEIVSNINNALSLPQTDLSAYYKFNQGIANGDNSLETTLNDEVGNYHGTLYNFALNGTTSNWISDSTITSHNHVYDSEITAQVNSNFFFEFDDISECQESVSLTVSVSGNDDFLGSADSAFDILIDGTTVLSGLVLNTLGQPDSQNYDLSSYLPFETVRLNQYHGGSGYDSVNVTYNAELSVMSPLPSMPSSPTVSDITYAEGETASLLTATLTGSGTRLKWYTSETGGLPSQTAPTPNTLAEETISYWVSQVDSNDCESIRSEIQVTIINTHNHVYDSEITSEIYPNFFFEFSDISECQESASLTVTVNGNGDFFGLANSEFDILIDGTTVFSNVVLNALGQPNSQNYDLSSYLPFETIRLNQHSGGSPLDDHEVTYNVELSVMSLLSTMPSSPTASDIIYAPGETASPLTAILTDTGTRLKWYTSEVGGLPLETAPIPNTSIEGTISYWVSQADSFDCESSRSEILVTTDNSLNVDDINKPSNNIILFPNPSAEFVQLSGLIEKESYIIYNVIGSQVLNGTIYNDEKIYIGNFIKGIYFLKLDNGNTIKFIKK